MTGKVVIITGASSGIGRATAIHFAKSGSNVIAVGRNEKELNALREQAQGKKGTIKIHLADMRETTQVERLVNDTVQAFDQIDVLVNSAGIIMNGSTENTSLDDWDKMMDINLRSVFFMMQKCIPHLEKTIDVYFNIIRTIEETR